MRLAAAQTGHRPVLHDALRFVHTQLPRHRFVDAAGERTMLARLPSCLTLRAVPQAAVVWIGALLLGVSIVGFNFLFLANLRESTLNSVELDLKRHSLTLAGQAEQSFKSLDLILSSVADSVLRRDISDQTAFAHSLSDHATHVLLKEKLSGLPQVDAITIINASGKLINFSRYWPIPEVNVSDRDYYKALKEDTRSTTFVSVPVQNRGTGTWTIYLARRLNGANGEFIGLVLGAMALKHFDDFYGATSLGEGSAVSLMRTDGTMLVRHPRTSEVGRVFKNAPPILNGGRSGAVRELSPIDNQMRIKSAHALANFPLFILTTQTEESALRPWRSMSQLMLALSLTLSGLIFIAAHFIVRWWRQQQIAVRIGEEKMMIEKARAEAETSLLRERERAAEAASRAKSSFLAVMSHEIRTPMNAVLGLACSLLEGPLTDEQRKLVTTIHQSGDDLLEILNDILDYSKLEAGELTLEAIAFAPPDIVEAAISIIGPRASAKGVKLSASYDPVLPAALMGDAGRLRQVLLNLISNAVKFTPAGEVTIGNRCCDRDETHARIEWVISDTGIGIAPDRVGSLFKDFVQADCSINRRFGGSGLGLSICKRIIDSMNGEISVASELGQGTTVRFSVELPIAEMLIAPEKVNDDASRTILHSKLGALGRPFRVLVADDNLTNRIVAAKMLQEFNVQIHMACDGTEAVDAEGRFTFDLILMDVRMPEMDGLTATRVIRSRGSRVPIIAFTANAFADDIKTCLDAGMSDFVAKPVRKKVLLDTVVRALQQSDGATVEQARNATSTHCERAVEQLPTLGKVFDRGTYEALAAELGEEAMREALAAFVQETSTRLKALGEYSLDASRSVIAREAHTIKGTAATFGFNRLSELAKWLERHADLIIASESDALIPQLKAEFALGQEQLTRPAALAA